MKKNFDRREFVLLASRSAGFCAVGSVSPFILTTCKTRGHNAATKDSTPGSAVQRTRMRVDDPQSRKNVDLYAKAVNAMKATNFPMPVLDENGQPATVTWWKAHALIHQNFCPHGNWYGHCE